MQAVPLTSPQPRAEPRIMRQPSLTTAVSSFTGGVAVDTSKEFKVGLGTLGSTIIDGAAAGVTMQSTNSAAIRIDKIADRDYSAFAAGDFMVLTFNIDDVSKLLDIFIGFDMQTPTAGNGYSVTLTPAAYTLVSGSNCLLIPRADFLFAGTGPAWWAIKQMRVRTKSISGAGNTVNVTYTGMKWIKNDLPRGIVCFTFDDMFEGQFTKALPKLAAKGWKATCFAPGIEETGYTERMTMGQLQQLHEIHGWDICAHSYIHGNMTALTEGENHADVAKETAWLAAHGIPANEFWAYPIGAYNSTLDGIMSKYFTYARKTEEGYCSAPAQRPMQMKTRSLQASPAVTLATAKTYIDATATNKYVTFILLHQIVDSIGTAGRDWLTADFNDLVDYIATKSVDVMSLSELMEATGGR